MRYAMTMLIISAFGAQSLYALDTADKDMGGFGLTGDVSVQKVAMPTGPEAVQNDGKAVFKGESKWKRANFQEFSPLERLGVQRSAEKSAMAACQDAEQENCGVLNSRITLCTGFACWAEAAAIPFKAPAGSSVRTVKGSSEWKSPNFFEFDSLEQLGVEKDAEDKALMACQSEGLSSCVGIGARITVCNGAFCRGEALAKGYAQ